MSQCSLSLFLYSNIKGDSLDSLLHRTGQELQFSAMSKYLNQIAQVNGEDAVRQRASFPAYVDPFEHIHNVFNG
jgi:hypothetical protein